MTRFLAGIFANAAIAMVVGVVGVLILVRVYGNDLPDDAELVNYRPAMMTRVYSGEGRVIAEYARERRIFVPVDEIPPMVRQAFISAEDKNFYNHPGVDAVGIAKAVVRYGMARAQGRPTRLTGASTITQQVMKNFLLDSRREIERKIKEMILAVRLDGALSKDQILELYLNEIFLGARSYGVAAAARNYFGKPLEALTLAEAAYLAALPKAPSNLHPVRNRDEAVDRRNYVLREMAENGYLDPAEAEEAKRAPLVTILDQSLPDPVEVDPPNYFTAEIRRQLAEEMGTEAVFTGGLTVRATIEPDLQDEAGKALRKALIRYDRRRGTYRGPYARIAAVAEEGSEADWARALSRLDLPGDVPGWVPAVVLAVDGEGADIGLIAEDSPPRLERLGMADTGWIGRISRGGKRRGKPGRPSDLYQPGDVVYVERDTENDRWELRQFPEIQGALMAMDPHTGRVLALQGGFSYDASRFNRATQARRQPGSAFKPFVYAAALDAGYSPSTVVLDAPVEVRLPTGTWRPKNSSGSYYGPTPLRLGIVHSRNLMTVRVAQAIGMDRVADYAERFGVYEDMPMHLSYALGAGETTLYDMVAAYGMFANGGKQVRPTLVDRIQDRDGTTLFRHDPRVCAGCTAAAYRPGSEPLLFDAREQIMNQVTATQLVSMMQGVVEVGTASKTVGTLDAPVAGKTGTTNDSRDAWFIGFTPNLVAGCFIGFDTPRPMGKGAYGGTLCGPVFRDFMQAALESHPPGSFPEPAGPEIVTVKIDRRTGKRLPDDATGEHVSIEVYRAGTEPPLYRQAEAIVADAMLFGGQAETLPYRITRQEDELPYEAGGGSSLPAEGGSRATSRGGGGGGSGSRPSRPRPPSGAGLDTGGLY